MAVYYVSPYTTTNGNGSWAAPYSTASSSRATLAAGDEIRLVARDLTTLLVPTVFTATLSSYNTLTITAGGSLGASWVANLVGYLPDSGTFFKVTSVSGNNITVSTISCLPWYNPSLGQTNITVRQVYTSQLPQTVASQYIWNNMRPDVTITDGWTGNGVRVTDGTAKTLISTSSGVCSLYVDATSNAPVQRDGAVIDLENTHIICGHGTTGGVVVYPTSAGATYTIGQVFNNSVNGSLRVGTSSSPFYGGSITIKHLADYLPTSSLYTNSTEFNFERVALRYADYLIGSNSSSNIPPPSGCIFNIGDVVAAGFGTATTMMHGSVANANTFNFNGAYETYITTNLVGIAMPFGNYTINFGPNFTQSANQRTSNITTSYLFYPVNANLIGPSVLSVPTIPTPPGIAVLSGATYMGGALFNIAGPADGQLFKQPYVIRIDCPQTPNVAARGYTRPLNVLVTMRDGSDPYEVLGVNNTSLMTSASPNNYPVVSRDYVTFRTAGPSLRAVLGTVNAAYWVRPANRAIKNIKIPVVQGQTYTVTGYVYTTQAAYANGDCRMSIVFNNAEVVGQDMTTACINAWEQFSLSFTASQTGEAVLAWEMYFSSAASYFLDDLVIS